MICIGTANAFIASLVQLGYSLSVEKAFPAVFSKVSRKNGVPRRMVVFICLFALAVILVTVFMDWTFQDLLFIPTSLGIWVYILSMASGLKLFKRDRLIWWSSLLSFLICVIVLPFFKMYLLVPLFVACLYMLYMMKQKKKENSDR